MNQKLTDGLALAGTLLRRERERQKMTQVALCQGLCAGSTLSKLEQGKIRLDLDLLCALFERLGFRYCTDERLLEEACRRIRRYYEAELYHFKNPSWNLYWAEVKEALFYSPLFLEVLLVEADQLRQRQGGRPALMQCLEMLESWRSELSAEQEARLDMLYPRRPAEAAELVPRLQRAHGVLGDSESGLALLECRLMAGQTGAVDELLERLVVKANQEGNTYNLARLTQLQAESAIIQGHYELALSFAQRALRLIWSSDWKDLVNQLRLLVSRLLFYIGDYEESLSVLQAVQRQADNGTEVQLYLASLYYRLGRREDADALVDELGTDLRLRQNEGLNALRFKALGFDQAPELLERREAGKLLERLLETAAAEKATLEVAIYKPMLLEHYTRSRQYKKAFELA